MITSTLISVIIPCYNYDSFLCEAVASVLSQKISNDLRIEIIIVDDCSTDKSLNLATEISKRFDNVRVIHNENNMGVSHTRNIGIENSKGRMIILLDADDKLKNDYIQNCVNTMNNHNADIVYTDSLFFGLRNELIKWPEFDIELLKKKNFINCSAMFKKSIWNDVGKFAEDMKDGLEDYCYWIRCAKKGYKIIKADNTYLWYRQHKNSSTDKVNDEIRNKVKQQLKEKHGDFIKE